MRFCSLKSPLLALVLGILLSACGTNPYSLPRIESPEPEYEEPAPEAKTVPPVKPVQRPEPVGAAGGLLAKADAARSQGAYDQSLAYLERAQRIDPHNAAVYLGLAQTHAAAGNTVQARATAERGLLYCSGSSQCEALRAYTR